MIHPLHIDTHSIPSGMLSEAQALFPAVMTAHRQLHEGRGPGAEYHGWLNWPSTMLESMDMRRIMATSKRLCRDTDVILVIGIGGSYLGAKAIIEALREPYAPATPEVHFIGHHLSGREIEGLKAYLRDKRFAINVISKSGTTTEPAVAFRIFKTLLEEQVGKEAAAQRIVATTDAHRGALRELAEREGYETYVIPDDIGGRYSVFTAVGLLPIACAGLEIAPLITGAEAAEKALKNPVDRQFYLYPALRNAFYAAGRKIELFVHYEPALGFVAEWWKQLFGESEGKAGKGLFPASVGYTTDLHSLGQYVQEGERHLFETVLAIEETGSTLRIENDALDSDGLNYLAGRRIDSVNAHAMQATMLAHADGGAPSLLLRLKHLDAYHLGWLLYYFQWSCALSGIVLGVNPFDQPGVEAYKNNMFALLEKPGHEAATKTLKKRLEGLQK
ncbi:MAG: glucose-6-phosphate isomerase [Acholeplasmatales bacterium]|nr:MAG: glucose-6-phosphate isomerase [Acholeplasmatales bacterium]